MSDESAAGAISSRTPFRLRRNKSRMSTIYVDSRRRILGSDSNFTFELPETLHMQSSAKMAVYKVRIADAFLSTDRGRNLYWIDQAMGTLNSAQLPVRAYTGARLAAWISSNYASAVYVQAQNSIAADGNRRAPRPFPQRARLPSRGLRHQPAKHQPPCKGHSPFNPYSTRFTSDRGSWATPPT